ncbi:MAG: hypothetical protein ABL908_18520, partial [Hyphomicrobium sp.]
MGNAADRIELLDVKPDHTRALERLLANLGDRARDGAGSVTVGTANAPLWSDLEHAIATRMTTAGTRADIRAREAAITAATLRLLDQRDNRDQRRADYLTMVGEIDDRGEAWSIGIPADVLARQLHRTLLWGTAWHLLGAGLPMVEVIGAIASGDTQKTTDVAVSQSILARAADLPLEQAWLDARNLAGRAMSATRSGASALVQDVARGIASHREQQELHRAAAAKAHEEQEAIRATKRRAQQEQAAQVVTAQSSVSANVMPDQTAGLDGRRLRGSVFGTWLMLVVLSWVSLVWGAMISLPVG